MSKVARFIYNQSGISILSSGIIHDDPTLRIEGCQLAYKRDSYLPEFPDFKEKYFKYGLLTVNCCTIYVTWC